MLGIRPGRQVRAAFADEFQRQRRAKTVNLRQIDADNRMQGGASVESRRIGRLVSVTGWRQPTDGFGNCVLHPIQHGRSLGVARRNLGLVGVVELQRLGKSKDVFPRQFPVRAAAILSTEA